MKCKNCQKDFPPDELDSIACATEEDKQRDTFTSDDGVCFSCANDDPYYNPDHTAAVKEILENAMNNLAAAKRVSPSKIKTDLVAEHAVNNPEKYIKEVVSQATVKKKKNDTAPN